MYLFFADDTQKRIQKKKVTLLAHARDVFWGLSKITDQTFCGQTDLTFPFISDLLVDLGRVVIRTE